jgi:3',5'-cyclic AMP phosphodiesterase CpdA
MLRRWGWAAVFFLACTASAAPAEVLPLRGGTLRIAVVGDVGDGASTVEAGIARVHVAAPLDAVIIPGDNFYPCSVTSVTDARWSIITPLTTLGVPLYPVLGNHDYCGKPDAQVQATGTVPHWRMPARSYVVRNELADFAMLDTTPYARGRSRDAEADVRDAFTGSIATWRIAVGHHTIVSSGWHGYLPRTEHRRMARLLPVLRTSKVDLYICGHDHHLELVAGRPRMLVSGAGSDPIPPVALHPSTLYPADAKRQGGFAVVELTATQMTITFYGMDGRAVGHAYAFAR